MHDAGSLVRITDSHLFLRQPVHRFRELRNGAKLQSFKGKKTIIISLKDETLLFSDPLTGSIYPYDRYTACLSHPMIFHHRRSPPPLSQSLPVAAITFPLFLHSLSLLLIQSRDISSFRLPHLQPSPRHGEAVGSQTSCDLSFVTLASPCSERLHGKAMIVTRGCQYFSIHYYLNESLFSPEPFFSPFYC